MPPCLKANLTPLALAQFVSPAASPRPGRTPRRQMQCDITLASELIQAPDQLKAAVVRLFRTHAEGSKGARRAALGEDAAGAAASSLAKR